MIEDLALNLKKVSYDAQFEFASRVSEYDFLYPVKKTDLAIYYKHPLMYFFSGEYDLANSYLDFIMRHFFQANGNFLTQENGLKSSNLIYNDFYNYPNGWIVRAANLLGRKDVVSKTLPYLTALQDKETGGFYSHKVEDSINDGITDIMTTAHLGLVHMESGYMSVAVLAADYLCDSISIQQENLDKAIFCNRDKNGKILTEFHDNKAIIYKVDRFDKDQLYFMVGYPIAFLAKLYLKTKEAKYLDFAKQYGNFALSCDSSMYSCNSSHKIAWGFSCLYKIEEKSEYFEVINKIMSHFISIKDENGLWFSDDDMTCYDQAAELSCWFADIAENIK